MFHQVKNIGNITADINKTVIKGTPLQNSMNERDEYLTTGKSDLLPRASIMPIGKQKINEKKETIKLKISHPTHLFQPTLVQKNLLKSNSRLR
jgi:hypothetical protein